MKKINANKLEFFVMYSIGIQVCYFVIKAIYFLSTFHKKQGD